MKAQNENPLSVLIELLNGMSAAQVRMNERIDEVGRVVAALVQEQGVHSRQIIALHRHFDELTSALAEGREPPAPPRPEQARQAAAEIDALDKIMRQSPPSEAV